MNGLGCQPFGQRRDLITNDVLSTTARAAETLAVRLDSDDGADLVVAWIVGELDFAESLQERRHVHPEATAIALAEAVPAADRVVLGAAPRLDGAVLGGLCSSAAPRSTQSPCSTSHA